MTAFQNAEALAGHRYNRDKMLAMVDEVTTYFRMSNSFERSKMRAVCRYLADALDRCSGSTVPTENIISVGQQKINNIQADLFGLSQRGEACNICYMDWKQP